LFGDLLEAGRNQKARQKDFNPMICNSSATSAQHPIRHRCRNVRCGAKLKVPTADARDAFCSAGCFASYYRSRCRVCERPIDRKTERRLVCKRSECRHEFQRHPERFSGPRYPTVVLGHNASENPIKSGLKIGTKAGRFRISAGAAPPEINLRIPLEPELTARLDRTHAAYFEARRKAKRRAVRAAQIKRRHPPVNVLGGYRFPNTPAIDMSPTDPAPEWAVASRWTPTGDGADVEDISDFLRRAAPRVLPAGDGLEKFAA
jgi:hypothetical protein